MVVAGTDAEVEDRLAYLTDRYSRFMSPAKVDETMAAFRKSPAVGTPEKVAEALRQVYDLGMTYAIGYFPDAAYGLEGVELFEKEVITALS